MSYQVLARKWRPRNFTQMVGQAHVVQALSNALTSDRLHHAYLFTGTRGVGKTTLARVLAKCLNCEQGVSASPCGTCWACTEIDEGRHVDLIEVDAASKSKVDETRELMENVAYAPVSGRHKVYLIDEVHMFSEKSFNALLKTLEEPPAHVKFLLATTDPQKLPITVLSRCLQFNLKPLPADQIAEHLSSIAEAEAVEAQGPAVRLIARAAQGSMRDSLSLMDQAIAYGNGKLTEAQVREMLGTLDERHLYGLLEALADGDAGAVVACVADMSADAIDFDDALAGLMSQLQQIAVWQLAPQAADAEDESAQASKALADRLTPEDVQLYYQMAAAGRRDLPYAAEPRSGFEMTALRMLAFTTEPPGTPPGSGSRSASVAAPVVRQQEAVASAAPAKPAQALHAPQTHTKAGSPMAPAVAPVQVPDVSAAATSTASNAVVASSPADDITPPSDANHGAGAGDADGDADAGTSTDAAVQSAAPTDDVDTQGPERWARMMNELGLKGMSRELASNCELVETSPSAVWLRLSPQHAPLANESSRTKLRGAIVARFGDGVDLRLDIAPIQGLTPTDLDALRAKERQQQAVAAIEADPGVAAFKAKFGARVEQDLVQPLD